MSADSQRVILRISIVSVLFLGSGGYLAWAMLSEEKSHRREDRPVNITVKRALNGHSVKFEPEGKLTYAGIRAPYENEPFFEESRQRNEALVGGKYIRLRFDGQPPQREDRIVAWPFLDDVLVSEVLVREGLAYVRLTSEQQRFGDRLIAAQTEARSERLGIWGLDSPTRENEYPADPKYGNFHRPNCEEAGKINPARRIQLSSRSDAFERGFAPCRKCFP